MPNRKSAIGTSPKNATVSRTSESTISSVISTESAAAANRTTLMTPSKRERTDGVRTRLVRTPVAPGDAGVTFPAIGYCAPSASVRAVLASPAWAEVSGTILAALAMVSCWATTKSMNALTSGRASAFEDGYMNSGRASGL